MNRWLATALALAIPGLAACVEEPAGRSFPEFRTYRHDLFATPEECEAAQRPGWLFSCSQDAYFFEDGSVMLVLTDVHNWGSYEIEGDDLRLDFDLEHAEVARWDFVMEGDSMLVDDAGDDWRLISSGREACLEIFFEECGG